MPEPTKIEPVIGNEIARWALIGAVRYGPKFAQLLFDLFSGNSVSKERFLGALELAATKPYDEYIEDAILRASGPDPVDPTI